MLNMVRVFILLSMFLASIPTAMAHPGNGVVVNVAKTTISIVVRQKGAAVEKTIVLNPGDTVRLRNFEQYELFIPSQSVVYDVDARATPGGSTPWHQRFYCVFRDELGSWKLGNGLVKSYRDAARRYVETTENELRAKWDRRLNPYRELKVDPAQLRYCEAFMLEAYVRRKLGLKLLIHPDPRSTGQDANNPATISIEALSCKEVPVSLVQQLKHLVKTALDCPFADVQFDTICVDEGVTNSIWKGVQRLSQTTSKTVKPPSREMSGIANVGGLFALIDTGNYFGVDGSGSVIDESVSELKKLNEIEARPEFAYLTGAATPVRNDIKTLAALSIESVENSAKRRFLMHSRINAHYGCSFLYARNPALEPTAVTLDDRQIVDVFTVDENGVIRRSTHVKYTNNVLTTLSNMEIRLIGYDYAEYRFKGFCDIIALAANDQAKEALETQFKWEPLPLGFVGSQFQASKRFCIRGVKTDGNGQIRSRSRILAFEPRSNRRYVIEGQNLVASPLPVNQP